MGLKRKKSRMPSMHGPAVQCCLCIVGVFMFLGGLIMMCTGIVLILNYNVFDVNILPPEMQNEDGKRTVGIILTTFGLLGILVSVLVSVLYLCTKNKPSTINADDMTRIPSSARNSTPDRPNGVVTADRRERDKKTSTQRGPQPQQANGKVVPGSMEVKHPRHYKGKRHRHSKGKFPVRSRLEEIKEADAISRKTLGTSRPDMSEYNDSLRSGSFSSEQTFEEGKTPRIVVGIQTAEYGRPPSVDSTSTSQTSDLSKSLDTDRLRKELTDAKSIELMSGGGRGEEIPLSEVYVSKPFQSANSLSGEERITGFKKKNSSDLLSSASTDLSYASSQQYEELPVDQIQDGLLFDSDSSVVSYKAVRKTEVQGMNTIGRMSPQVDSPEMSTMVEPFDDSLLNDSRTQLTQTTFEIPDNPDRVDRKSEDEEDIIPEQVPWRFEENVHEHHGPSNDKEGLV